MLRNDLKDNFRVKPNKSLGLGELISIIGKHNLYLFSDLNKTYFGIRKCMINMGTTKM